MNSLTADWQRHNAIVVIGYPATKGLIRFYTELGARRDYPPGHGNGKRRMAVDTAPPTAAAAELPGAAATPRRTATD
ncbi:MAG TPA: hypothetical protein VIJ23_08315 [Mycobacterium sp.]